MSNFNYECRFCLKKLLQNEKMALIDEEIRNQFTNITQMQLELNGNFSQIICELCLRSLQLANALKTQFIENQRKLYYTLNSQLQIAEITHYSAETPQEPVPKRRKITENPQSSYNYADLHQESENNDNDVTVSEPILNIKEEKVDDYPEQHAIHESQQYYLDNQLLDEMKMEIKPNIGQLIMQNMQNSTPIVPLKLFGCCYCPNKYRRRDHMSRHIQEEHKGIKFRCVVPGCLMIYRRKEKVRSHLITKHKDLNETDLATMLEMVKTITPFYENES